MRVSGPSFCVPQLTTLAIFLFPDHFHQVSEQVPGVLLSSEGPTAGCAGQLPAPQAVSSPCSPEASSGYLPRAGCWWVAGFMNQWFGLNLLKMDKTTEAMQASHPRVLVMRLSALTMERQEGAEAGAPGAPCRPQALPRRREPRGSPPCAAACLCFESLCADR